jgi:hypothetical protein
MTDLRSQIREAVIRAECERPGKCSDCITDSVLNVVLDVVDARVERSARAARECARNTDAAAEMIRTTIQTAHHRGPAEGIRVLTKMSANVDGLLDGLDLPEPAPAADPALVAELLGADPDWLGGQSVDDYVRDARR